MAGEMEEEIKSLRRECEWVLKEEVQNALHELQAILTEACKSFPVQINPGAEALGKPEKFILSSQTGTQQVKCVMTLMGETICEAELTMKLAKTQGVPVMCRIYPDTPWRLQQVQDANNNLLRALSLVDGLDESGHAFSAQQILHLLDDVTTCLNRGRSCLAMPKRKTIEELVNNPYLNCFKPPLPKEMAVSFYVQAQKVILTVYSLAQSPAQKVEVSSRIQGECSVPWLNDVLVLFTLALQLCQQLLDKIKVFEQYQAELQTTLLRSPNKSKTPVCDNLLDLTESSNQLQSHSNGQDLRGYQQVLSSGVHETPASRPSSFGHGETTKVTGYHSNTRSNQGDLLSDVFSIVEKNEQHSKLDQPLTDLLTDTKSRSNNPFHSNEMSFSYYESEKSKIPSDSRVDSSTTSRQSRDNVTVENLLDL